MSRKWLLTDIIKGEIEVRLGVMGRCGRRFKKLLDDLNEKRGYLKLKVEVLDLTLWRARFGTGYGPVVRQIKERILHKVKNVCS